MYVIQEYSKKQAKKLGVVLRLSSNTKKKIDVYKAIPLAVGETKKKYEKVASIGAIGYSDYAITGDKEKRRLYRLRHKGEDKKIGSNGYYAWKILW